MNRILITGASSGLGAGLAKAYARPGASIGLIARRPAELKAVAAAVRDRGASAKLYLVDVRDGDAMEAAIRDFHREAGGLDIVIANAGIGEGRTRESWTAQSAARVFEVNVIGLCNTLLPALDLMRSQGSGTLVAMASVAGFRALPGSLAYSASKAAVMTFMEGLSLELRGTNLHSVTLCPGFVRTPLTDKNNFHMPFLIELDDACLRMKRAIDTKQKRFVFPLPMAIAARVMHLAPGWLWQILAPTKKPKRPAQKP
jgi:short-subunit dehydrogenase